MTEETNDSSAVPVILRWEEYRRAVRWQTSTAWGSHCGEYPEVTATNAKCRTLLVPEAQSVAAKQEQGDVLILSVRGTVEFRVGSEDYAMVPWDIITIPAQVTYGFANVGLEPALLFKVTADGVAVERRDGVGPNYSPWEAARRHFHWDLPLAESWGNHRGSGPMVGSASLIGHLVRHPVGQSAPWHAIPRDLLFVQLRGEVEFHAAGRALALKPLDVMMMPANTPYNYTNIGLTEAVFFDVGGPRPAGKSPTYYRSDPGWPVRPDAEKFVVEIGSTGEARLISPH